MLALKCMQSDPVKLLNVKLDLKEAISTANGIVKIKKKDCYLINDDNKAVFVFLMSKKEAVFT